MTRMFALATALFATQALPAMAEGQMVAVPAGDHLLAFALPPGFVAVSEGDVVARLEGENADAWTQAITLTVDPERANRDPSMDISMLGGVIQALCPDTLDQAGYDSFDVSGTENGAYTAWNSCGTVVGSEPPRSEQHFSVAVSGPSGGYMLTWIVRGPASDERLRHTNDEIDAQIDLLTNGIKVCEVTNGEGAPYPSCVDG